MVPRRRRADVGRPAVPVRAGRLPPAAVRRRRGRSRRPARRRASPTGRAARWSATPRASPSRWPAGRRGTRRSRSASARRSAASCAPPAPNLTGAVCVNVLRHPAWGRAQETYGEDPHHVGELGAALTRGLQRHVLACVKHFACNSMENARFTRRHRGRRGRPARGLPAALPPDRRRGRRLGDVGVQLRQRRVVRAEPRRCSTDVLRDEWGFDGLRHQRLDLRAARRGDLADAPGSTSRCPTAWSAPSTCRVPWSAATRRGTTSTRAVDADRRHPAALRRGALGADPPQRPRLARAPDAGPRGGRPLRRPAAQRARRGRAGAAACRPAHARRRARPAGRHGQPRRRRIERRVGPRLPSPCSTGCATRSRRRPRRRRRPRARRGRRRRQPTSLVVVVGYTYLDEGEYIGDHRPVARATCSPQPTSPTWSSASRPRSSTCRRPTKPARLGERPSGFSAGGDRASRCA